MEGRQLTTERKVLMENINLLGVSGVAFIVIMCLMIGVIIKATGINNKWIPVICGVCGAILGAVALRFGAEGFPATDYFQAVAIGIVSGLGSVGCHQIVKQLTAGETIDFESMYDEAKSELTLLQNDTNTLLEKNEALQKDVEYWHAAYEESAVKEV